METYSSKQKADSDGLDLSKYSSSRSSAPSWDYLDLSSGFWCPGKQGSSSEMLRVWELNIELTREEATNQCVTYCTFSMVDMAFSRSEDGRR